MPMGETKTTKGICNCEYVSFSYEGNYYLVLNDCPVHKGVLNLCECEATSKTCPEGSYYLVRFNCSAHQGSLKEARAE
jgi:hypothetical protein